MESCEKKNGGLNELVRNIGLNWIGSDWIRLDRRSWLLVLILLRQSAQQMTNDAELFVLLAEC